MRELIYYIASTLDGFIAHEDGSFDGFRWDEKFVAEMFASFPETIPIHLRNSESIGAKNKRFDIVLMGRKTYEVGLKEGITNPYPSLRQYVFSRTMEESPDENVELVSENAGELVTELKKEAGKDIWLCGGADLGRAFFTENLIDRIIVKLNPVLFGSGIPLFSGGVKQTALVLTDSKSYSSGHVLLDYQVKTLKFRA